MRGTKIAAIRGDLPVAIQDPIVEKIDIGGAPVVSLAVRSSSLSPRDLTTLVEKKIKRRLENISGVGRIDLIGAVTREVGVEVARSRLRASPLWPRTRSSSQPCSRARYGHEYHYHDHDEAHDHDDSRTFTEIRKLIAKSKLSPWVKKKSVAVFQRIAEAEGEIHGMPPEKVHFHEVGAVDSIVDIVGACIALEMLGKPRVLAAPVVEGVGCVNCAHGRFPIPAPATLAILGARGIGVTQTDEPHELVTPTGAALLAEFAETLERLRASVGGADGASISLSRAVGSARPQRRSAPARRR